MKQEMININANLLAEPIFSSFENDGQKVEVAKFTLVKKSMEKAKNIYQLCSLRRKSRESKGL